MTTLNDLFDTIRHNIATHPTLRKIDNGVLQSPHKQHPFFCDLDPHADYTIWSYDELLQRTNGNTYTYPVGHQRAGQTLDCTLIWCLNNANATARKQIARGKKEIGEWQTFEKSFKTWAKDAGCSIHFLIAVILATNNPRLKDSPIFDYAMDLVKDIDSAEQSS
jgi:hypothetical protein